MIRNHDRDITRTSLNHRPRWRTAARIIGVRVAIRHPGVDDVVAGAARVAIAGSATERGVDGCGIGARADGGGGGFDEGGRGAGSRADRTLSDGFGILLFRGACVSDWMEWVGWCEGEGERKSRRTDVKPTE